MGARGLEPPLGNATGGRGSARYEIMPLLQAVLIIFQLVYLVGMSFLSTFEEEKNRIESIQ